MKNALPITSLRTAYGFRLVINITVLLVLVALAAPAGWVQLRAASETNSFTQETEVRAIYDEGRKAFGSGNYAEANRLWNIALTKAKAIGNDRLVAQTLNALAVISEELGESDQSLAYLDQSLPLWERLADKAGIARTWHNRGRSYRTKGQLRNSINSYRRSIEINKLTGSEQTVELGRSYTALGDALNAHGDFEDALDCLRRAEVLFHEANESDELGDVLLNRANILESIGRFDEVRTNLDDALKIYRIANDVLGQARVLHNLANLMVTTGRFDRALELQMESLGLKLATKNEISLAYSYHDLGSIYEALGQFERALDNYQLALEIRNRKGSPRQRAETLLNMANIYQQQGRDDMALRVLIEASKLVNESDDQMTFAILQHELAGANAKSGKFNEALTFEAKALKIFENLRNPEPLSAVLTGASSLYARQGNAAAALSANRRALEMRRKLGNRVGIAENLANIGVLEMQAGHVVAAANSFDESITNIEGASFQLQSPSEIGSIQRTISNVYGRYALMLIRQNRINEALQLAERGRARGLALQIAYGQVALNPFLPREEAAKLIKTEQTLTAAGQRLRNLVTEPDPPNRIDLDALEADRQNAARHFRMAESALASLHDGLAARYLPYRQVQVWKPAQGSQLLNLAARHTDTMFLEWLEVDERVSLLFTLSHKRGLRAFELTGRSNTMDSLAKTWREFLTESRGGELNRAQALTSFAMGPLLRNGNFNLDGCTHVAASADGPLLGLPLAAFADSSGHRLLEYASVRKLISLSAALWPARHISEGHLGTLLCAVDPLSTGDPPARTRSGESNVSSIRIGATPLRWAAKEADSICLRFKGALRLQGRAAREARVKAEMPSRDILHFVTHGFFNEHRGLLSWILLASEPPGSSEDGRLEAREILTIPLCARLVVLSVCESGRGQPMAGEGFLGFGWAFNAAGCRSIVVSHWQVNDKATSELMAAFYERLRKSQPKDLALRNAMQAIRRYRPEPYFWAAFELVGDESPLTMTAGPVIGKPH